MSTYPCRPCPACGGNESRALRRLQDHVSHELFDLHECGACGLWYVKDPPTPGAMAGYYGNVAGDLMRDRPSPFFLSLQRWRLRSDLAELRRKLAPGARVLDLGAGDGALCDCLQHLGFVAKGVDGYPARRWPWPSIPYEEADLNGDPFPIESLRFPDGAWPDAVILRHVLEHLLEPRRVLERFAQAPIPHVLVVVPNVDSRLRRLFGANWAYWDPPRHLTQFSPATLKALADRAGYRAIAERTYGLDEVCFSLFRAALLRRPGPQSPVPFWAHWLNPKSPLAAVSSAISSVVTNTVCLCLLEKRRERPAGCG